MFQNIEDLLHKILKNQEIIMSGLTDLQTFMGATLPAFATQVATDITNLTAAVNALIAAVQAGGDNDAAVEAAVQQGNATLANLQTDDASIEALTASAQQAVPASQVKSSATEAKK